MNCTKCGEVCSCAESFPSEGMADSGRAELPAKVFGPDEADGLDAGAWRDELSEKLSRYRARRKAPPPRYPSLNLPFEKLVYTTRTGPTHPAPLQSFEPNSNQALALDGIRPEPAQSSLVEVQTEPLPTRIAASSQAATAKIIEFPRFAWAPPPPPPDQLAEPVGEQLRILEVPEFQPPPPALGGITIEPVAREPIEKQLGIDIPFQIAPLERRLAATVVDGFIIGAAATLFGIIFWKVTAVRPPDLQLLSLGLATLAGFWAVYQYLLIVYSGSTPGLRTAGLQLTRFDGSATTRSLRRWRILAAFLSALSLGMGYAWVFLDEDSLCWHDRITRTHLGMKKKLEDAG